jgi:hypothetical protein
MINWCSGVVSLVRGQREGWEKSLQMLTTARPTGVVTSLEAWSKPFSFCPLLSYEETLDPVLWIGQRWRHDGISSLEALPLLLVESSLDSWSRC